MLNLELWDGDGHNSECLGWANLNLEQLAAAGGFYGELPLRGSTGHLGLKVKQKGQDYPHVGPEPEISVTVERGDQQGFGIDFDSQDAVNLLVTSVKHGGAFDRYNMCVKPHEQVTRSDFIVAVNGVSGSSEALSNELIQNSTVTAVVRRAIAVSCIMNKMSAAETLGLEFPEELVGEGLVVIGIGKGLVSDYNSRCSRETQRIKVGDRIVNIQGETGVALELKGRLDKTAGSLQLGILRMCPDWAPGASDGDYFRYW
jgi:hypothetical protein